MGNKTNGIKPEWQTIIDGDYNLERELDMFAEDKLYDDDTKDKFVNVLGDNNLLNNEDAYADYSADNKGCNIDNPFTIDTDDYFCNVKFEYDVVEWISHYFSERFIDIEFKGQQLIFHNDKPIDCLSFEVKDYENGSTSTENYYFDITEGMKQRDAFFEKMRT